MEGWVGWEGLGCCICVDTQPSESLLRVLRWRSVEMSRAESGLPILCEAGDW